MGNRPALRAWKVAFHLSLGLVATTRPATPEGEPPALLPGRYEVLQQLDLPGLSMEPPTEVTCLDPDAARDLRAVILEGVPVEGCASTDLVSGGGRWTFSVTCPERDGSARTTRVEIELEADRYFGRLRTEVAGRVTELKRWGRRIGSCDP